MSDTTLILRVNLLGRLFGKPDITFQSDALMAYKRGFQVASNNICECKVFATLKHGLFGSTISLTIGQKKVQFRFLKKGGVDVFLNQLNESIAGYINDYLSRTFNEFNTNVILEYPRDSRLEQISLCCQTLHENYMNQAGMWETYLAADYIKKVKEIIGFLPVRAEALRNHHEKTQLGRRKDFFDRVESNPLTLEQRLGVLRSNDRNMVLAAAGTGKTSVMVAKALDLIDRGLAQPSEILVLAYNRLAAEELKERLIEKAEKGGIKLQSFPQISTFHALGRKLLRDAGVSTHISVFTEDETKLKQWVTSWLEAYLAADGARFLNFISLFPEPVNPFDFKTQADYERYVRDNEFRTLNGERVKGYQELLIANYLYANESPRV